jgi:hypothetical protein
MSWVEPTSALKRVLQEAQSITSIGLMEGVQSGA